MDSTKPFNSQLTSQKSLILELLLLAALITCSFTISNHFIAYEDLPLWDEANYLAKGLQFDFEKLGMGPLYRLWYFALSKFQADPIKRYQLNISILFNLLTTLSYLLCRQLGAEKIISFLISILILFSSINLLVLQTKVNLFSAVFLLIGFNLSYFLSIKNLIAISLLLSALIRPELILAFFIFVSIDFYKKVYITLSSNKKIIYLLAYGILLIAGLYLFDQSRSSIAFRQGFAVNYSKWVKLDYNPWKNYKEISKLAFGNEDTTVSEAFVANPKLWIQNLVFNFKNYFHYTFKFILPFNSSVLNLCLLAFSYALFRKQAEQKNKLLLVSTASIAIAQLVSSALVFILPRYLVVQNVFLLILSASLIKKPKTTGQIFLASLCLFIGYQNHFRFQDGININKQIISELKKSNLETPLLMFENLGGVCNYLNPSCKYLWINNKDQKDSFIEFVKKEKINAILINKELREDPRLINDQSWLEFVKNPEQHNFIEYKFTVKEELSLLLRKHIPTH